MHQDSPFSPSLKHKNAVLDTWIKSTLLFSRVALHIVIRIKQKFDKGIIISTGNCNLVIFHLADEFVCFFEELGNVLLGVIVHADNLVLELMPMEAGNYWGGIEDVRDTFSSQGFKIFGCTNGTCRSHLYPMFV